jgi:hypothetical protein
MSEDSSERGIPITKVVEMHLEGTKWLLAIMAGMLVYGLDRLTEHPVAGFPLYLFAASSLGLSVSAAAALYYLLKSYAYASTGAEIEPAPQDAAAAKNPEREKMYNRIGIAYSLMIWSFSFGGGLYLLFGLHQIVTIKVPEPETRIETSDQDVFLTRAGQSWVLKNGRKGPVWVRLPDAPKQ